MNRHGFFVVSLTLLAGCVSSNFNLATQRLDYTITSTDKEVALGNKISRKVEEEFTLLEDEAVQRRVDGLGERIVAVCDRKELVYSFNVIDGEEVNAFSLPGGYVYVFSGLVEHTDSDDELAGVIAHEVAHITARHAVKRYEGGLGQQLVQLAALASGQGQAAGGMSVALRAAHLAYARGDELEADRLAVTYLQAAGFDPTKMLIFLEKLQGLPRKRSSYMPRGIVRPQYASTHPYVPDRKRAVKEALYDVADYLDYLNTAE